MSEKQPVNDEKGTARDLMKTAIDPSDIDMNPQSGTFGKPRFLSWVRKNANTPNEVWEAVGKDGTVYTMIEDKPEEPPKQYKMIVDETNKKEVK